MRYYLYILIAVSCIFCFSQAMGQASSNFGASRPQDSSITRAQLVLKAYYPAGKTKYLTVTPTGHVVLDSIFSQLQPGYGLLSVEDTVIVDTALLSQYFIARGDSGMSFVTPDQLGTGTLNYISKFSISGFPLTSSSIKDTGFRVGILQPNPQHALDILGTTKTNKLLVTGDIDTGTPDAAIKVSRLLTGGSSAGHAFRDETIFGRSAWSGYNSYDAAPNIVAGSMDHVVAFQSRMNYISNDTIDYLYTLYGINKVLGNGHVRKLYSGGIATNSQTSKQGSIGTQYGFYVTSLTTGLRNFAFVSENLTPSSFGGNIGVGLPLDSIPSGTEIFNSPTPRGTLHLYGLTPNVRFHYSAGAEMSMGVNGSGFHAYSSGNMTYGFYSGGIPRLYVSAVGNTSVTGNFSARGQLTLDSGNAGNIINIIGRTNSQANIAITNNFSGNAFAGLSLTLPNATSGNINYTALLAPTSVGARVYGINHQLTTGSHAFTINSVIRFRVDEATNSSINPLAVGMNTPSGTQLDIAAGTATLSSMRIRPMTALKPNPLPGDVVNNGGSFYYAVLANRYARAVLTDTLPPSVGQIPIANSTGNYTNATLTAGQGILIANASGSITVKVDTMAIALSSYFIDTVAKTGTASISPPALTNQYYVDATTGNVTLTINTAFAKQTIHVTRNDSTANIVTIQFTGRTINGNPTYTSLVNQNSNAPFLNNGTTDIRIQ